MNSTGSWSISDKSAILLSMKTYLEKIRTPPNDPMTVERDRILEGMKLRSMISDPSLVERVSEDFEKLKRGYANRYQIVIENIARR